MQKIEQKKLSYSKEEKKLNQRKLKEFREILKNSSLDDIDKKNIEFIAEYFKGKHEPRLASRLFLFHGDPGIGKTFLAEKLLQTLEVEIIYMSCADFSFPHGKKCRSFDELIRIASNNKKQVLFLDDLSYLFERDEGGISSTDKRLFMRLLDMVKSNPSKVVLATMNNYYCLDERMFDRIEVKIDFGLPSNTNKKVFLDMNYKDHLNSRHRKYIADNSIGYNYRDIPEVVKLAYRLGKSSIDMNSLKKAVKLYRPTQLYGFNVQNGIDLGLKDVIGKPKAKSIVKRLVQLYKHDDIGERLGLKRSNLLMFHGLPGTGKSFMARALAGEIGFPLVCIRAGQIHRGDPFSGVNFITDMAKRYKNCVIFIDEAEKILGNGRFEEDNPVLGELHRCIDSAEGDDIQSIFVLAINDIDRFGETLLDRFVLVPFEMPSFEERLAYFEKKVEHIGRGFKLDSPCSHLARVTENMSYRDMDRYWNDFMFCYLDNKNKGVEEVASIIAAQFVRQDPREVMFA